MFILKIISLLLFPYFVQSNITINYNVDTFDSLNSLKLSLLSEYNKDNIPKKNSNPVNISMELVLSSINDIDQIEGTISFNVWLRYHWYDYQLEWSKNKYNISQITFTSEPDFETSIWIPDIILYNNAQMEHNHLHYTRILVNSKGKVFWSRPGLIKALCDFDLNRYPFDKQNCHLKFGSWSFSEKDIVLTSLRDDIDLTYYKDNEEWQLEKTESKVNIIKYTCCSESYYDITFSFFFKRLSAYYESNILFPVFAISALNLVTVFIPWDSGERISFAVTLMLSIVVFLLLVSDNIPKTNQKPLLSRIITSLTIFSLGSVLYIVIINYINNYREIHINDKQNHNIKNRFVYYIYHGFKKINFIEDNNQKLKRNDSYLNANFENVKYKIVNNNILKIIKCFEMSYVFFFCIFFIGICLYLKLS